jgi:hypothetical protein
MIGAIKNFQTISRHEAKLRQSPVVIECLTAVLNYVKSVLNDDGTQELVDLLNQHMALEGDTAHYENLDLMHSQIIQTLRRAFVGVGLYTNNRITEEQFLYFFRDIYDGYERFNDVRVLQVGTEYDTDFIIPEDETKFVHWLIENPQYYIENIPEDPDEIGTALSVKVTEEYFEENHNSRVDAHENTLSVKLDELMTMCSVLPIYVLSPISFDLSTYRILDEESFERLMLLLSNQLIALGNPQTIDYTTYQDTVEFIITHGFEQALLISTDFFVNIYPYLDVTYGVYNLQYDIYSLEALFFGGEETLIGYNELLDACGETDDRIFKKKYTDYYLNHLDYVLSDSMTPEYRAELTTLRGNIHTNYSKVYNIFTVLNQNNFSIYATLSLSHLVTLKTLDLFNVVGLTKSIACLSLIPYNDGEDKNKLVISYDNYNPAFTETLIDNIKGGDINHISVVLSISKSNLVCHIEVNDNYAKYTFSNTNRMFDVFPFFLFVIPRVANYLNGTNRITSLKLFSKPLSDEDSVAAIAGFSQ